jgi:hypothetical protein
LTKHVEKIAEDEQVAWQKSKMWENVCLNFWNLYYVLWIFPMLKSHLS